SPFRYPEPVPHNSGESVYRRNISRDHGCFNGRFLLERGFCLAPGKDDVRQGRNRCPCGVASLTHHLVVRCFPGAAIILFASCHITIRWTRAEPAGLLSTTWP